MYTLEFELCTDPAIGQLSYPPYSKLAFTIPLLRAYSIVFLPSDLQFMICRLWADSVEKQRIADAESGRWVGGRTSF